MVAVVTQEILDYCVLKKTMTVLSTQAKLLQNLLQELTNTFIKLLQYLFKPTKTQFHTRTWTHLFSVYLTFDDLTIPKTL